MNGDDFLIHPAHVLPRGWKRRSGLTVMYIWHGGEFVGERDAADSASRMLDGMTVVSMADLSREIAPPMLPTMPRLPDDHCLSPMRDHISTCCS
jgi:hypothetical protein